MEKDPAVRERNRWVHFAIRSIDGLSATDLSKVAPTKVGGDDVRTVTLVAHGDIELHSLPSKTQKDAAARGASPRSRGLAGRHEADVDRAREQGDARSRSRSPITT